MVCKTYNYHIWALRHIRRLLTLDVARTLACSIVGARLDYCNSVLEGAPTSSIQKLQRVQNSLPRIVLKQPRMSHDSPLLKSLHLLPVSQRIEFKVAVLTYKIRSTSRPAYLHSLLSNRISESTATWRCHVGLPELSTAVALLVSLRQLYGTVCLLTSLTLHH